MTRETPPQGRRRGADLQLSATRAAFPFTPLTSSRLRPGSIPRPAKGALSSTGGKKEEKSLYITQSCQLLSRSKARGQGKAVSSRRRPARARLHQGNDPGGATAKLSCLPSATVLLKELGQELPARTPPEQRAEAPAPTSAARRGRCVCSPPLLRVTPYKGCY